MKRGIHLYFDVQALERMQSQADSAGLPLSRWIENVTDPSRMNIVIPEMPILKHFSLATGKPITTLPDFASEQAALEKAQEGK